MFFVQSLRAIERVRPLPDITAAESEVLTDDALQQYIEGFIKNDTYWAELPDRLPFVLCMLEREENVLAKRDGLRPDQSIEDVEIGYIQAKQSTGFPKKVIYRVLGYILELRAKNPKD